MHFGHPHSIKQAKTRTFFRSVFLLFSDRDAEMLGHETINQQELHVRKFLYKSSLNSACFYKQKTNIFRYQTSHFLKIRFFFLVHKKEWKRGKIQFVTKFIGINVTIVPQIASKIFATQCSFTDPLKDKFVNKTTCRIPSTNYPQLESFSTVIFVFLGFQSFLIYLVKYFWPVWNSP